MEVRRKREPSKKYIDYVTDNVIMSYCQGCNQYVQANEKGVVCATCVAYWHYECADVSEEDVAKLGKREFYCKKHIQDGMEIAETDLSTVTDDLYQADGGVLTSFIKMLPYVLNDSEVCKKRLKGLSSRYKVTKKDKGKQFTVKVNTVTYALIVNGLIAMGESRGIKIKREDIDSEGTKLQVIFQIAFTKGDIEVSITMTCYHTTNNILIQMNGNCSGVVQEERLKLMDSFVNLTMVEMIKKVERMEGYENIRENMRQELCTEKIIERSNGVETRSRIENIPGQMLLSWVGVDGVRKIDCDDREILSNSSQCENPSRSNQLEIKYVCNDGPSESSTACDEVVPEVITECPSPLRIESSECADCENYPDEFVVENSTKVTEINQANVTQINIIRSEIKSVCDNGTGTDPGEVEVNEVTDNGQETAAGDVEGNEVAVVINSAKPLLRIEPFDCADNENLSSDVAAVNSTEVSAEIPQTNMCRVNTSQLIVRKEASNMRKLSQAFDAIKTFRNNGEEKQNILYNIILKLKEKNCDIRMEHTQFVHPVATSQINALTVKLVQSQKEYEDMKRKCKDLESQVKDLKKEKEDEIYLRKQKAKEEIELKKISSEAQEKEKKLLSEKINELDVKCTELEKSQGENMKLIQELEREVAIKDQKINEHKHISDDLRQSVAKLVNEKKEMKKKEDELNNKLGVMQAVAGAVAEVGDSEQLVLVTKEVSNNDAIKEKEQEISTLKKKVNECNKKNSLLIDDLEEKRTNLEAIDNFYKDMLQQKDQVIAEYLSILGNDNGDTVKLKRLLTKFRTDSEINLIRELKSSLENDNRILEQKANVKDGEVKQSKKVENAIGDASLQKGTERESIDRVNTQEASKRPTVKKLCKFGKKCDTIECNFSHDYVQKPCRFWPSCEKGDSCLFIHESNGLTWGNANASDRRCAVSANGNSAYLQSCHGQPRYGMLLGPPSHVTHEPSNSGTGCSSREYPIKGTVGNNPHMVNGVNGLSVYTNHRLSQMDYDRRNGRSEQFNIGFDNNLYSQQHGNGGHIPRNIDDGPGKGTSNQYTLSNRNTRSFQRARMCRFGLSCEGIDRGCEFGHEVIQKLCRFGIDCNRKSTCLFIHESNERKVGVNDHGNNSKNQLSR